MQLGIHLPHVGRKANPDSIRRAAIQAESLGFNDLWVSEHIILPNGAPYPPSPIFYEPVLSLTWAAAFTTRIKLGTTVLVLPLRHPVPLAKELATLALLSNGRLILGAGVGWMEAEFRALGANFNQRGRRMDEGLALMKALWTTDPVTFQTKLIEAEIEDMRMRPLPPPIPIWIGGNSPPALARALKHDGWHGTRQTPEEAKTLVQTLRATRPGHDFTISLRTSWDGQDPDALKSRLEAYAEAGITHLMVEPTDRELDPWLHTVEKIAKAASL